LKIITGRDKDYWNGGVIKCRSCGSELQAGIDDLYFSKKWKGFYELMCPECSMIAGSVDKDKIDPAQRERAKKIAKKNLYEATRGPEKLFLPILFLNDDHPAQATAAIILALILLGIIGGLLMRTH
jgi:hypothetical protein